MSQFPETLRKKPIQTRAESQLESIVAAAVALYNDPKVGRDRMTTAMVVAEAGCSIGTLYRYFTSRLAILDHIAPHRDQTPIRAKVEAQ